MVVLLGRLHEERAHRGLAQARLALGEHASALEECREAITILQPLVVADAHDYWTEDLWVRSHVCIGQENEARDASEWLARIGYRQGSYRRFLSSQMR